MATNSVSLDSMKEILTKLEDIYNSQAALNEKLAVVQMALEDAQDVDLEATLVEAYGNAQRNAELIKDATHKYEMAVNARRMQGGG